MVRWDSFTSAHPQGVSYASRKMGVTSVFANRLDPLARSVSANSRYETSRPMRFSDGPSIHSIVPWMDGVCVSGKINHESGHTQTLATGLIEADLPAVKHNRSLEEWAACRGN